LKRRSDADRDKSIVADDNPIESDPPALRLTILVDSTNERSKAVARRLGIQLEGQIRDERLNSSSMPQDMLIFGLTREDYAHCWSRASPKMGPFSSPRPFAGRGRVRGVGDWPHRLESPEP